MANGRRVVVITGVTRGLGKALALGFAARGHIVAGCGRSQSALTVLGQQLPPPHCLRMVDVACEQAVAEWAREVVDRLGPPDLLVNNAAVIHPNAPLWRIAAADFDAVIEVNVKGIARVIRHFVPAMIARGSGVIVNMSSGWGRSTSPEVAGYCASKWAVEGLTRALAQELPQGMAAIPLNPGIIDTDMLRSCFGPAAHAYPAPEVWAEKAVPFLLALGPRDNGRPLTVPGF
ncbi:MAG: oxidoreductase [Gemmataceae bacterium]